MPLLPSVLVNWSPVGLLVGFLILWAEFRVLKARLDGVDTRLDGIQANMREGFAQQRADIKELRELLIKALTRDPITAP